MSLIFKIAVLAAAAFAMNLPLGYLRQGSRRFSFAWFFYVHLSIPFIVLLRTGMGVSYWYIPFSLGSAVAGQIVGGRLKKAG